MRLKEQEQGEQMRRGYDERNMPVVGLAMGGNMHTSLLSAPRGTHSIWFARLHAMSLTPSQVQLCVPRVLRLVCPSQSLFISSST